MNRTTWDIATYRHSQLVIEKTLTQSTPTWHLMISFDSDVLYLLHFFKKKNLPRVFWIISRINTALYSKKHMFNFLCALKKSIVAKKNPKKKTKQLEKHRKKSPPRLSSRAGVRLRGLPPSQASRAIWCFFLCKRRFYMFIIYEYRNHIHIYYIYTIFGTNINIHIKCCSVHVIHTLQIWYDFFFAETDLSRKREFRNNVKIWGHLQKLSLCLRWSSLVY